MAVVVQDDQDVQNAGNVQTLLVALHFAAHQQAPAAGVPNRPVAQLAPALSKNPPLAAWPSPSAWAPASAFQFFLERFLHKDL